MEFDLLHIQIKLVSSYHAEIKLVKSMVVKITGSGETILFLPFAIAATYYPFMLLTNKFDAAEKLLRGTAESDRSQQHSSAEDPALPSDTEPDQNHNHWLVSPRKETPWTVIR